MKQILDFEPLILVQSQVIICVKVYSFSISEHKNSQFGANDCQIVVYMLTTSVPLRVLTLLIQIQTTA